MDYDKMEKAANYLRQWIKDNKGDGPIYALSGSKNEFTLNYSPGKNIYLNVDRILEDLEESNNHYLDWALSHLEFEPVWEETETGYTRINA